MPWLRMAIAHQMISQEQERFDRLHLKAGRPAGAIMFVTKNALSPTQEIYLNPMAEQIAGVMYRSLGATECQPPNPASVTPLSEIPEAHGNG